jgi:hypothetical protein
VGNVGLRNLLDSVDQGEAGLRAICEAYGSNDFHGLQNLPADLATTTTNGA